MACLKMLKLFFYKFPLSSVSYNKVYHTSIRSCISLLFLILFFSCVSKEKESGDKQYTSELIVYDSLDISFLGTLQVSDFSESRETYLGFDFQLNTILEFDQNGLISTFKPIEGPNNYGERLYGLGYFSDTLKVVLSQKGFFFYSSTWKLVKRLVAHDSKYTSVNSQFRLLKYVDETRNAVLALGEESPSEIGIFVEEKEYYNRKQHFSLVDVASDSFKSFINYPHESIYRKGDIWYPQNSALFDFDSESKVLYVLFEIEPRIYRYKLNWDRVTIIDSISTLPENMQPPMSAPFGQAIDELKSLAVSGYYTNIFVKNDTIIAEYQKGINEVSYGVSSVAEFSQLYSNLQRRFLQIFVNGKKVSSDIEIPNRFMSIAYADGLNRILLYDNSAVTGEKDSFQRFYYAKITLK